MKRNWTLEEETYLRENIGKKEISEIANHLHRSERAVNLFIFRNRIDTGKQKGKNNLLRCLIETKFGDIRYFTPCKDFYKRVGITQMRWHKLLRGECQILPEEYNRVVTELKMSASEIVRSKQLQLFDV